MSLIDSPKNGLKAEYDRLLESSMQAEEHLELQRAVELCQQAIDLRPNFFKGYRLLGKFLARSQKPEAAIQALEQAVSIKPHSPQISLSLAKLYVSAGRFEEALSTLKQSGVYIPVVLPAMRSRLAVQSVLRQAGKKSAASLLYLWEQFHRLSASLGQNTAVDQSTQTIRSTDINSFLSECSQYQVIRLFENLEAKTLAVRQLSFSIESLQRNCPVELFDQIKHSRYNRRTLDRINLATAFQLDAITHNRISVVCPLTQDTLYSQRSFPLQNGNIFYQFLGQELFYLIVGDAWFERTALYYPDHELVIILCPTTFQPDKSLNLFKKTIIENYADAIRYVTVSNADSSAIPNVQSSQPKSAILTQNLHFGHHLWNELTGIDKLVSLQLVDKVDTFICASEALGPIDSIFPEIPASKIQRAEKQAILKQVLQQRLFALPLGGCYVTNNLSRRLYRVAQSLSSTTELERVRQAKERHRVLLWVTIRLDSRTWISQTEGIANILNFLSRQQDDLGVIFDGFSLPEPADRVANSDIQTLIDRELETVDDIISQVHDNNTHFYNLIGGQMHQSIIWAHAADVYLAHQGSIQHKIGWIANKPGVVHTNSKMLEKPLSVRPGCWEREDIEIPEYIPKEYIEDIEGRAWVRGVWTAAGNSNYEVNWEITAQALLKLFHRHLS